MFPYAPARVVSLLEYRKTKAETQMALPMPDASLLVRARSPLTARQARHRERMLEHMASLASPTPTPMSDARCPMPDE